MTVLLIILILIAIALGWWLSTLRYIKIPAGQTIMFGFFDEPTIVAGNTLPEIPITPKLLDRTEDELKKMKPRLDKKGAILWKIFPMQKGHFDYRYKHFKPIGEIKKTGGEIRWQPEVPLNPDGTPQYKENPDYVVALGEWKEVGKLSLHREEHESIIINFTSQEMIRGAKKALIRILVYDMPLFTRSLYNLKEGMEKKIVDRFQQWARTKNYFDHILGIGWQTVEFDGTSGEDFIKNLNEELFLKGCLIIGIDLFEDYIYQSSQDVYDAKEKWFKEGFLKKSAQIDAEVERIKGEGIRDKQLAINQGEENRLAIVNAAEIKKDKELKANETDQYRQKLDLEKENELAIFNAQTDKTVEANGKILNKAIELKQTPDETLKHKYSSIRFSNVTTLIETGTRDSVDNLDENIVAHATANLITLPKTKRNGNK